MRGRVVESLNPFRQVKWLRVKLIDIFLSVFTLLDGFHEVPNGLGVLLRLFMITGKWRKTGVFLLFLMVYRLPATGWALLPVRVVRPSNPTSSDGHRPCRRVVTTGGPGTSVSGDVPLDTLGVSGESGLPRMSRWKGRYLVTLMGPVSGSSFTQESSFVSL